MSNNSDTLFSTSQIVLTVLCMVLLFGGLLAGCPQYEIYTQRLYGQAELARSEAAKMVMVEEARAKLESAKLLNQAEVERAKGIAEANRIIGDSLQGNEAYLRYLWIQTLEDKTSERIYIPTEAGLPLLEARPKNNK